jgi:hypothetical protein
MLGFKQFSAAAITVANIELIHRISKGQFNSGSLVLKDKNTPAVWSAVITT